MTKIVINQSNYIPWKGYFDLIHDADIFVFYDDVQYTKNDWRNRNKIKTPDGSQWLTIPVGDNINRLICEVAIDNPHWQIKHWKAISQHYGRAPFFKRYREFLKYVYLENTWTTLSSINQFMISTIARDYLGINAVMEHSSCISSEGVRQDRVLSLIKSLEGSVYYSGPAGKVYLDPARFQSENIKLVWKDYSGYPHYKQFFAPFDHAVSILDLLFHTGPDAPYYIWGWRESSSLPMRNASYG